MGGDANGPAAPCQRAGAPVGYAGNVNRRRTLTIVALLVLAVVVGRWVRNSIGVEFSSDSIQEWVAGLGWMAPASFVALVSFRHFLLLPSALVLSAGGVCFGATYGALLGATGVAISGLGQFGIVRGVRPEFALSRMGQPIRRFSEIIERAGGWIVALATAHPASPMTAFHWGAGLTTMPVLIFAIALSLGAVTRSFAYAFFGSTLLDPGSPRFYVAGLVLVTASLLPLAHPGIRRRLLSPHVSTPASGS